MTRYINRKDSDGVETVDSLEVNNKLDRQELSRLLLEYTMSDAYGYYYISQRACKDWN